MNAVNRIALVAAAALICSPAMADKYVPGYFKKDGTYVEGHFKTEANSTKFDNYSTKGNTNPYTGERGYADPYAPKKFSTPKSPYSFDDGLDTSSSKKKSKW